MGHRAEHAGIYHEGGDRTSSLHSRCGCVFQRHVIRDVDSQRQRRSRRMVGQIPRHRAIAVSAEPREQRLANPASPAGNHRDASVHEC